ncbi:hypothetical protein M0P48_01770 [Candidatus Gracilibacteria bacterium]|jgi:hypothetical protein|nr:hypothetical protein [Candidatus Gracilibacteria bacterium]
MREQNTCPLFKRDQVSHGDTIIVVPNGETPILARIEVHNRFEHMYKTKPEPSIFDLSIYDGDPSGKEMTLDVAGICKERAIVTKTCLEKFCGNPDNFRNCPILKEFWAPKIDTTTPSPTPSPADEPR